MACSKKCTLLVLVHALQSDHIIWFYIVEQFKLLLPVSALIELIRLQFLMLRLQHCAKATRVF